MLWISHKITTFSIVFAATRNLLFSIVAAVASILPDFLEVPWLMKHRGLSHSVPVWLGLTTAVIIGSWNSPTLPKWGTIAVCLGVLMHLVEDAFSVMGVPVYGNKSIALKVYRTGGVSEFIAVAVVVGLAYITFFSNQGGFLPLKLYK